VYIECHKSTGTSPVDKGARIRFAELTYIALITLNNGAHIEVRHLCVCTYTSRQPMDCRDVELECTMSHSSLLLPEV